MLRPLPLFLRTLVVTAVLGALLPMMLAAGGGAIVNVVPIMAYLSVPGMQRLFAGWLNAR